jgi:hypothetical protein
VIHLLPEWTKLQARVVRRRAGHGHRHADDRVRAEPRLARRAVKVDQRLVHEPLVVGLVAEQLVLNLLGHGVDGLGDPLAAVPADGGSGNASAVISAFPRPPREDIAAQRRHLELIASDQVEERLQVPLLRPPDLPPGPPPCCIPRDGMYHDRAIGDPLSCGWLCRGLSRVRRDLRGDDVSRSIGEGMDTQSLGLL